MFESTGEQHFQRRGRARSEQRGGALEAGFAEITERREASVLAEEPHQIRRMQPHGSGQRRQIPSLRKTRLEQLRSADDGWMWCSDDPPRPRGQRRRQLTEHLDQSRDQAATPIGGVRLPLDAVDPIQPTGAARQRGWRQPRHRRTRSPRFGPAGPKQVREHGFAVGPRKRRLQKLPCEDKVVVAEVATISIGVPLAGVEGDDLARGKGSIAIHRFVPAGAAQNENKLEEVVSVRSEFGLAFYPDRTDSAGPSPKIVTAVQHGNGPMGRGFVGRHVNGSQLAGVATARHNPGVLLESGMAAIVLNESDYLNRVRGCWTGKNIGGTIGEPFEWRRRQNHVTFYTQELHGRAAPNDDLDIQLLWLIALEERGVALDAHVLADYWCLYVTPHWSEYGRAKVNFRSGLPPPLAGSFANRYKDSCGAFIRSEIWACVAPGCPDLAAGYALEDAMLDHGDGEGTYGEVFCAAMESAAFVVADLREVIDIGLSYIPADCGVARAVRSAVALAEAGVPLPEARLKLLEEHRGAASRPEWVTGEERSRGLHEGKVGYDAPLNLAIVVYALAAGGDDFGAVQCLAVNCGEDTDCTAATAGALWGILHGYDAIPRRWIEPIGDGIVTVSLNKGELGHFGARIPQTVSELSARTLAMTRLMLHSRARDRVVLRSDAPCDLAALELGRLRSPDASAALFRRLRGPVYEFAFFRVELDCHGDPAIRTGREKSVAVTIFNTYKPQANLALRWHLPPGWSVSPAAQGVLPINVGIFGGPATIEFSLTAATLAAGINRAVLELTAEGRPTTMLVPLALINGDLLPPALAEG